MHHGSSYDALMNVSPRQCHVERPCKLLTDSGFVD